MSTDKVNKKLFCYINISDALNLASDLDKERKAENRENVRIYFLRD